MLSLMKPNGLPKKTVPMPSKENLCQSIRPIAFQRLVERCQGLEGIW